MDLFDIDDETIDAEVLDHMYVNNDDFKFAADKTEPSSLRQTIIEIPDISWDDIGGLEEVKVSVFCCHSSRKIALFLFRTLDEPSHPHLSLSFNPSTA